MTTRAQLRKAAGDLPEVEQNGAGPGASYTVRGQTFAALTDQGSAVDLRLPPDDAERVVSEHSSAAVVTRGQRVTGVRIPLADVNGMVLNALVARAWRHRAPAQLRQDFDRAAAGEVSTDLPPIGRPATRALVAAGITGLDQVAARSEADLLELHGVGPRAVRILAGALADQGRSLR